MDEGNLPDKIHFNITPDGQHIVEDYSGIGRTSYDLDQYGNPINVHSTLYGVDPRRHGIFPGHIDFDQFRR